MGAEKIYLIGSDEELTPMTEELYEKEDVLQILLEKYPDLLAGEQMNKAAPRRWVLIERHMGVTDKEGGSDRWRMDHLFLDQDGIPTLVEVKRSTDPRIRREAVGQMLDYAANAVVYWPVEKIQTSFEKTCEKGGCDSSQVLANLLQLEEIDEESDEISIDRFWVDVNTCLMAGKVRMVFIADEIPDELLRVVEFLNEQMDPAEVLAVELKQFVGENVKTLVPRVLGQTAESRQKKGGRIMEKYEWDEKAFFEELRSRVRKGELTEYHVRAIKKLYDFSSEVGEIIWGTGKKGEFRASIPSVKCKKNNPYTVHVDGSLRLNFGYFLDKGRDFREKLKKLGFHESTEVWDNPHPALKPEAWTGSVDEFIAIIRELIDGE